MAETPVRLDSVVSSFAIDKNETNIDAQRTSMLRALDEVTAQIQKRIETLKTWSDGKDHLPQFESRLQELQALRDTWKTLSGEPLLAEWEKVTTALQGINAHIKTINGTISNVNNDVVGDLPQETAPAGLAEAKTSVDTAIAGLEALDPKTVGDAVNALPVMRAEVEKLIMQVDTLIKSLPAESPHKSTLGALKKELEAQKATVESKIEEAKTAAPAITHMLPLPQDKREQFDKGKAAALQTLRKLQVALSGISATAPAPTSSEAPAAEDTSDTQAPAAEAAPTAEGTLSEGDLLAGLPAVMGKIASTTTEAGKLPADLAKKVEAAKKKPDTGPDDGTNDLAIGTFIEQTSDAGGRRVVNAFPLAKVVVKETTDNKVVLYDESLKERTVYHRVVPIGTVNNTYSISEQQYTAIQSAISGKKADTIQKLKAEMGKQLQVPADRIQFALQSGGNPKIYKLLVRKYPEATKAPVDNSSKPEQQKTVAEKIAKSKALLKEAKALTDQLIQKYHDETLNKATAKLDEAIALTPNMPELYYEKVTIYDFARMDYKEHFAKQAIEAGKKYLDLTKGKQTGERQEVLTILGMFSIESSDLSVLDPTASIAYYKESIAIDVKGIYYPINWVGLLEKYVKLGQWDNAKELAATIQSKGIDKDINKAKDTNDYSNKERYAMILLALEHQTKGSLALARIEEMYEKQNLDISPMNTTEYLAVATADEEATVKGLMDKVIDKALKEKDIGGATFAFDGIMRWGKRMGKGDLMQAYYEKSKVKIPNGTLRTYLDVSYKAMQGTYDLMGLSIDNKDLGRHEKARLTLIEVQRLRDAQELDKAQKLMGTVSQHLHNGLGYILKSKQDFLGRLGLPFEEKLLRAYYSQHIAW